MAEACAHCSRLKGISSGDAFWRVSLWAEPQGWKEEKCAVWHRKGSTVRVQLIWVCKEGVGGGGGVWNRGQKGASGQVVKSIFPASFLRVGLYPKAVHLPLPSLFSMLQAEGLLNSQNSCYSLAN